MTIKILDPTVAPELVEALVANRIDGLDGRVLGLLSNGKVNADRLLDLVREGLASRWELREVVVRAKANPSRVVTDDILEELVRDCDAIVTAIGD